MPVWLRAVVFGIAYFLCAQSAHFLSFEPGGLVTLWLPSGLFVSILLLHDKRDWKWFAAAALPPSIVFGLLHDCPFCPSTLFWFGHSLEALAGAWLVRRFAGERTSLSSAREVALFGLFSSILSTGIAPTVVFAASYSLLGAQPSWFEWWAWWRADALGILVFAPVTLVWLNSPSQLKRLFPSPARTIEFLGILCLIGLAAAGAFYREAGLAPLLGRYIAFPFLIWAALRFDAPGVTAGGLVLSVLAVFITIDHNAGVTLSEFEAVERLWSLQAFLGICVSTMLAVVAVLAERARDREALAQSERRYRLIFENAPLAIMYFDGQGNVTDHNDALPEMFSVPGGKYDGFNLVRDMKDPEMVAAALKCLGGRPAFFEGDYSSAISGKKVPIRAFFNCKKSENGTVLGGVAIFEDVTESKRARQEVIHLHRQNQLILDSADEGIIGLDTTGKIIFANPCATRTLGHSAPELIGRELHPLVHHTRRDGAPYPLEECPMHAALTKGTPCRVRDEVLWRKDGDSFPAVYSATPTIEEGAILGAVITFRDISERRAAEKAKMELELQIRQSQKVEALGTLAGGIAHDFNNVLSAIIGYTELALEPLSEESREARNLRQVLNAANRARDLVKQILLFSRKSKLEMKPLMLGPTIKEIIKLVRAALPSTIDIRSHITTSDKDFVVGDPTQIHQILMNLCTNAAHAMEGKPGMMKIEVSDAALSRNGVTAPPDMDSKPYIRIAVTDTGCGIDPEHLDQIFDPFFTTKAPGEGTGMGLAVVQGIVKSHGGFVSVSSKPGEGSTLAVYLPRVRSAAMSPNEKVEAIPRGAESILFIDDEEAIAALGKEMLERLGYKVITSTSSRQALELFETHGDLFDLVITDFTMPLMTGADLARKILSIRPEIPIILSTGYSEEIDENKARAIGVKELIFKPLNRMQLSGAIRRVLGKRLN